VRGRQLERLGDGAVQVVRHLRGRPAAELALAVDRDQPDMVGAECFRPVTTRSFFVPSGY